MKILTLIMHEDVGLHRITTKMQLDVETWLSQHSGARARSAESLITKMAEGLEGTKKNLPKET